MTPSTECGFCENGVAIIRGRAVECPYCDGTGKAPHEGSTTNNERS